MKPMWTIAAGGRNYRKKIRNSRKKSCRHSSNAGREGAEASRKAIRVASIKASVAYIGLGSNLEHPVQQIRNAMRALSHLPQTRVIADSGLFLSKPMTPPAGEIDQPDYYNAVAKIETRLGPYELLDQLQLIEQAQRRKRLQYWGPRTIDLDILMYDDLQISDERLTLPHPGVHKREFVLYPLNRIDSSLEIHGRGMLNELIEHCSQNGLQYLGAIEGDKDEPGD